MCRRACNECRQQFRQRKPNGKESVGQRDGKQANRVVGSSKVEIIVIGQPNWTGPAKLSRKSPQTSQQTIDPSPAQTGFSRQLAPPYCNCCWSDGINDKTGLWCWTCFQVGQTDKGRFNLAGLSTHPLPLVLDTIKRVQASSQLPTFGRKWHLVHLHRNRSYWRIARQRPKVFRPADYKGNSLSKMNVVPVNNISSTWPVLIDSHSLQQTWPTW